MSKIQQTKHLLMGLVLFFISFNSYSEWQMDSASSSIHFVSVKKNTIGENHYFRKFKSTVAEDGKFTLNINLATVETLIPIRNERMQKLFFQIDKFPTATVTGEINLKAFKSHESRGN